MKKLTCYNGGENLHELSKVYVDGPDTPEIFPANVFLFAHESGKIVLFDTGHPESYENCGLRGKVYTKILPATTANEGSLVEQLDRDGISPSDISHVILSHLHPDHIGGVKNFTNSRILISSGVAETMKHPSIRSGFFRALLPSNFEEANLAIISEEQLRSTDSSANAGFDVFGDESLVLVELPGHAQGQLGAFVLGETLLAADSAWSDDYLDKADCLKTIPRVINDNFREYKDTARRLVALKKNGTLIILSHVQHPKVVIE